ncbi:hypothetical protein L6164_022984 [Bauhinia variegata]|uniref:Uncharacterized protein n=1 Tax=Bauhinia variegata TaxID=167791 RepID=A0ACB9MJW4_BAUVA|nr:hypothetical protein L6164_022984 [Bauhinia variegata]
MFYSQTFLARKGPLGTVWCAAHLQHRLKKSHYTSTDIPSTVDRIMFPEVPIALRMSGHLLLGVVRIYSKKVDYLFHDCNVALTGLTKAFASIQLSLPEDARKAPFESITLPKTFDLDTLDLDYGMDYDRFEDSHLSNQEDITLTDQIPLVKDHYITISFDEDIMMDSSHMEVLPDSVVRPTEEDIHPQSPMQDSGPSNLRESSPQHTDGHGFQDARPSNQTDVQNISPSDGSSPQVTPDIEVLRDHDLNQKSPPVFPNVEDNNTDPNRVSDQTMNGKAHTPPVIDDVDFGRPSGRSPQHSGPPSPATFPDAPERQVSPDLALRSTSPIQQPHETQVPFVLRPSPPFQQPQRRGKKRKQYFDKSTVLTNQFMKKALNDSSDLLRKRSTSTAWWKINNSRLKEQVFYQPLIPGQFVDLLNTSTRDYICAKPHLVHSEENHADSEIVGIPSPSKQTPEEPRAATPSTAAYDMEFEHLRDAVSTPPAPVPDHFMETELDNAQGDHISPVRRVDLTPMSAQGSVPPEGAYNMTETKQTPDMFSEIDTPMISPDTRTFTENFDRSDVHEFNFTEPDELSFLEKDDNTPASSHAGSDGVNSLSVRTRAVAQFLKSHSPLSPIMDDEGDLSLNKILEGKTRKVSARMFYETLVLKSYGLVDVQQEEPYGDINLKLTPTLSKAQI